MGIGTGLPRWTAARGLGITSISAASADIPCDEGADGELCFLPTLPSQPVWVSGAMVKTTGFAEEIPNACR